MDRDDTLREPEKARVREGGDRGDRSPGADWNRTAAERHEAPLSAEERAERAAVAKPQDGVGCPFGKVPDRASIQGAIQRLSPEKKALLRNPDAVVHLTGTASRVGSEQLNDSLSLERAKAVAEVLHADPQVKARIAPPEGVGNQKAIDDGHPPNKDNREDRVVLIDVGLERKQKDDKEPPKPRAEVEKPKVAPEKPKPVPDKKEGSEKGKGEIPEQYTRDYKLPRKVAEGRFFQGVERAKEGLKGKWGMLYESLRQILDADRYEREMGLAKTPDDKLWGVRPMRGFLIDIDKPSEQAKLKSWLREGGYDVDKMSREYVIHWIRKGAR